MLGAVSLLLGSRKLMRRGLDMETYRERRYGCWRYVTDNDIGSAKANKADLAFAVRAREFYGQLMCHKNRRIVEEGQYRDQFNEHISIDQQ